MLLPLIKPVWGRYDGDMPNQYIQSDTQYANILIDDVLKARTIYQPAVSLARVLPSGAVLAGGYVASAMSGEQLASDIDIFFMNQDAFVNTFNCIRLADSNPDLWPLHGYTTDVDIYDASINKMRHVKFTPKDSSKLPIQLVKLIWFDSPAHIIDSFDFTVTQFAMTKDQLTFNPISMMDLFRKQLAVNRSQYPLTMMRRMIKYINKGYTINSLVLGDIIARIKSSEESTDPNFVDPIY